jgi:hypothetical protein
MDVNMNTMERATIAIRVAEDGKMDTLRRQNASALIAGF